MTSTLLLALAGPDLRALLHRLRELGLPHAEEPSALTIDAKARAVGRDWLDRSADACKLTFVAKWPDASRLRLDRDEIVKLCIEDADLRPRDLCELLSQLPFTLASCASIYPQWSDGTLGEDYLGEGFGDLHMAHGPICAFKGAGHERLVSRRWLEFGPWRVLHGSHDTTLVQFHEVDIEAREALEQARPGHRRMGISSTGGFLQTPFNYRFERSGRYLPALRKLDIVVNGRTVSEREMLEAAAIRRFQALGPDQPIDSVAYTFVDEQEARAHLHELWLRELECWAIIKGTETRLDVAYAPQPTPPDWVRRAGISTPLA